MGNHGHDRDTPALSSKKKININKARATRSAAPSPSAQRPPRSHIPTPFLQGGIFTNAQLTKQRARSNPPSPPLQATAELADQPPTLDQDIVAANEYLAKQRVRSNAPSPSLSPTVAQFPSMNTGAGSGSDIKTKKQEDWQQSNVTSPSPPFENEAESQQDCERRYGSRAWSAPRTIRSSAPSPDREADMSGTLTAANLGGGGGRRAGTAGTDDATMGSDSDSEYADSERKLYADVGFGEDSSDDELGGWRGCGGAYNADNDQLLRDMYRQSVTSVTNTVSVSNAPAPAQAPDCGNMKNEDQSEDEGGWNPPNAPKAMRSHLTTWINDKKVGERINGVQVPLENEDEVGSKGGKKSSRSKGSKTKIQWSGKLKVGKKG